MSYVYADSQLDFSTTEIGDARASTVPRTFFQDIIYFIVNINSCFGRSGPIMRAQSNIYWTGIQVVCEPGGLLAVPA